jgi:hypothetical protein
MSTEYSAAVFYGVLVTYNEVDAWEDKTSKDFCGQEAHGCHVLTYGDMVYDGCSYAVCIEESVKWAKLSNATILTNEIPESWNERISLFFKEFDIPYDKTPSWILTMERG